VPLLFIDGKDDEAFLQAFHPLNGAVIRRHKEINLRPGNMSRLHSMLASKFTRIVYLKDPEFTPPTLIKDQTTQPATFYWQLPCIESNLILHYFKNGMSVPGRLLRNAEAPTLQEQLDQYFKTGNYWTEYFAGVQEAVVRLKPTTSVLPNAFILALEELQKSHEHRDYVTIVRAIQGHTFVKEIAKGDTGDLINALKGSGLHPEVAALLGETTNKIKASLFPNDTFFFCVNNRRTSALGPA